MLVRYLLLSMAMLFLSLLQNGRLWRSLVVSLLMVCYRLRSLPVVVG